LIQARISPKNFLFKRAERDLIEPFFAVVENRRPPLFDIVPSKENDRADGEPSARYLRQRTHRGRTCSSDVQVIIRR
jgi:hypothetical protein